MDFNDACKLLTDANQDCSPRDLRIALNAEVESRSENMTGSSRNRYERAVSDSYHGMTHWLETGDEFAVNLEWGDLARFISGRSPACAYCVLIAKARAAKARQEASERASMDAVKRDFERLLYNLADREE